MTRLRNIPYSLSPSERELIRTLAKTGVISLEQRKLHFPVTDLASLITRRLVRISFDGRFRKVITLHQSGITYAKKYLLHGDHLYRRNSNQIEHDLRLSSIYLKLSPEERRSWITEARIREMLDERSLHENQTIDAVYRTASGKIVGVEVITPSYTAAMIAARMATLNLFEEQVVAYVS